MENVISINFLQIILIIDISLLVSNFICPHVSSTGWKYTIYKSTYVATRLYLFYCIELLV